MRRFFINPEDIKISAGIIAGEEAHHMLHVLRLKSGQDIELVDGTGNIYKAKITSTTKKEVGVIIIDIRKVKDKPPFLHLGVALLDGKKMELVIQKATELGIATIQPFTSKYNSTTKEVSINKEQRWQKISAEACKQSGRSVPPEIKPQTSLKNIFNGSDRFDLKIIFYEDENKFGMDVIEKKLLGSTPDSLIYLIGPKGGFSDDEIALANQSGFISIGLGPLVLRAETAAITGASLLQYLLGKLTPEN